MAIVFFIAHFDIMFTTAIVAAKIAEISDLFGAWSCSLYFRSFIPSNQLYSHHFALFWINEQSTLLASSVKAEVVYYCMLNQRVAN